MEEFKYGVSYVGKKGDVQVIKNTMAACFSGLRGQNMDNLTLSNTVEKRTKKYREKYLRVINEIYPIEWDDKNVYLKLVNPITEKSLEMDKNSDNRILVSILMLIRVLHDDIGKEFDNIEFLKQVCSLRITKRDMLKALLEKVKTGEGWSVGEMWNSNHFLSHAPLMVRSKKEFYTSKFTYINTYFKDNRPKSIREKK